MNNHAIWTYTKGFKPNEGNWGNPTKMKGFILISITLIQAEWKRRINEEDKFIIIAGYEQIDDKYENKHKTGRAIDFYIETELPYYDQTKVLLEIFDTLHLSYDVGFGIYPDRVNPAFHLEERGKKVRWGRADNIRNKYIMGGNIFIPNNGYLSFRDALQYIRMKEGITFKRQTHITDITSGVEHV